MTDDGCTYLIRFDDICPTMDWAIWERIETVLLAHQIRPILAVVPDNQDPTLVMGSAVCDFWDRVRQWQSRGWSIALHGYQHRYVNGNSGMLRLGNKSEFAGLSRDEQKHKLQAGLAKFHAEGVQADAWVAPGHSFDETTVKILLDLGVRVISDGFSLFPFDSPPGVTWVPQQLWRFRPRRSGVWTVCFHSNEWNAAKCLEFSHEVTAFRNRIGSLEEVVARWQGRAPDFRDWLNRLLVTLELRGKAKMEAFRSLSAPTKPESPLTGKCRTPLARG